MMGQRILGLTGGLGTGKSTVASLLEQEQIPVVDADQLARQAVQPGSPILDQIVNRFGSEILDPSGHLNRRRLGQRVFAHPEERTWLEAQIHPYVRQQLQSFLAQRIQAPILCLMIPLLFEAHMTDLVTEIWVVSCPEYLQKQRVLQRDPLTSAEVEERIRSQWPLDAKIEAADVVIDNGGSLDHLRLQVLKALRS